MEPIRWSSEMMMMKLGRLLFDGNGTQEESRQTARSINVERRIFGTMDFLSDEDYNLFAVSHPGAALGASLLW